MSYQQAVTEARIEIDGMLNKYSLMSIIQAIRDICEERDIVLLTPFIDSPDQSVLESFNDAKRRLDH